VECAWCPAGKYDGLASEVCALCEDGKYGGEGLEASCFECGVDQYATDDRASCTACPEHMSTNTNTGVGAATEVVSSNPEVSTSPSCLCDPGYFFDDTQSGNTSPCFPCTAGRYLPAVGRETECTACAAGYVQPSAASSSCTACLPGTYDDGTEVCAQCAAGQAQGSGGQTACSECGAGQYQAADFTSCPACAAGRVQALAGQAACDACPEHTFQAIRRGRARPFAGRPLRSVQRRFHK
jgi:hypothetical protein